MTDIHLTAEGLAKIKVELEELRGPRRQELEFMVRNAVIIEKSANHDIVSIGSHVTIQEGDYPAETYHVVGPKEADPRNGRISHESPIGRALMDHRVGEVVDVDTPEGKIKFKILKIE